MRITLTLIALVSMIGCPPGSTTPTQTEPSPTEPSQTEPSPTEPSPTEPAGGDLESQLAGLAATPTDAPPAFNSTGSPQVYEGLDTIGLTDSTTGGGTETEAGAIHTTPPTGPGLPYNEKWVAFDQGALLLPSTGGSPSKKMNLRFQPLEPPDKGELTPARITTYCARTDAANLRLADQSVNYFGFPPSDTITNLSAGNLPNTTATLTYEVWTANQGNFTRSGTLYREIQTPPTGPQVYRDFWVLDSDYVFPGPAHFTHLRAVNTGGFTTLKTFLTAMQTERALDPADKQVKWKYSPVTYSWTALCPTP